MITAATNAESCFVLLNVSANGHRRALSVPTCDNQVPNKVVTVSGAFLVTVPKNVLAPGYLGTRRALQDVYGERESSRDTTDKEILCVY